MKKITKTITGLILLSALFLVMAPGVSAVEESFTINGAGNIEINIPTAPVFTPAVHNDFIETGSDIVFNGSNEGIGITDETGTNSGWKFSISITDFHASGIDDPTDSGSAAMDVYIASGDWLTFDIDNSSDGINDDGSHTLIPGSGGAGGTVTDSNVLFFGTGLPVASPNCSAIQADTINIVTVSPGYGAGKYLLDLNYTITIDEWLPEGTRIDSAASAGGRFDQMDIGSSDKVQVFAGTYSADITYSTSCNPAS